MLVIFILFLCAIALLMSWRSRNKKKNFVAPSPSAPPSKKIIKKPIRIPQPVRETRKSHVNIFRPLSKPTKSPPQVPFTIIPTRVKSERLPMAGRFASVLFPRCSREYHYLMNKVPDLKVGDVVLVPIHKKLRKDELLFADEVGLKIRETTCLPAVVKYISYPGEVLEYARSEVIKKVNGSSNFNSQSNERFLSVIFKKGGRKRYDYFVEDNHNLKVDDFVVVPVYEYDPAKFDLKIAKIKYISSYGEISNKAHSMVIGKADRYSW